jgi:5-methylcytosine-specific restriction protein A
MTLMPSVTVKYRAVHTNTAWRKVHGHTSLQNAIYGQKDGAPGLFEHRVRIDYKKHGEPLYVVIWMDTEPFGFVVRKDTSSSDGTMRVQVDTALLQKYDENGGASVRELEGHFSSPAVDPATAAKLSLNEASIDQAEEGAITLQEHLLRERNAALAEAKKAEVFRNTGGLACEVCDLISQKYMAS